MRTFTWAHFDQRYRLALQEPAKMQDFLRIYRPLYPFQKLFHYFWSQERKGKGKSLFYFTL
jgi:hypothetical protein